MGLTEEQKKRMEDNRLKALAKRQEKQTTVTKVTPMTTVPKATPLTAVTKVMAPIRPSMPPTSFTSNHFFCSLRQFMNWNIK